jgi:hypothetical protein
MDPAIVALAELPEPEFCALLTRDEVADITGIAVGEGSFLSVEGLGTNCIYYPEDDFALVLKFEVGFLAYSDYAALAGMQIGEDGPPPAEACEVAGREAMCAEPYDDPEGFASSGYQIVLKLGTDADPYLLVEAPDGDAATAASETILSRIG